MDEKSKVYIRVDAEQRITACDGGYSIGNIENYDEWVLIDEGFGDKYNLCQSNYFDKPLYEEHGIPVYKYENGCATERSQAEINADIAALPVPEPQPTPEERLAELEAQNQMLTQCLMEMSQIVYA